MPEPLQADKTTVTPPRRTSLWVLGLAAGLAVVGLYAAAVHFLSDEESLRPFINYVELAKSAVVALLAIVAARRAWGFRPRLGAAWSLFAAGFVGYAGGDFFAAVFHVQIAGGPYTWAAGLLYLSIYPFFVAGALSLPHTPLSGTEKMRLALDMGIIMLASGLLLWMLLLSPLTLRGGANWTAEFFTLVFPVLDVALIWTMLALGLRKRPAGGAVIRLLGLAAAALALTDLFYSYVILGGDRPAYIWVSMGYMASGIFAALAALQQMREIRSPVADPVGGPAEARPAVLSTYLAIVGLGAAWVAMLAKGVLATSVLTVLAFPSLIIVLLARQVFETRLNARLNRSLRLSRDDMEDRVHARTAELSCAYEDLQAEVQVRKKAEEAVASSEERFRSLVQNSYDMITLHAPEGTVLYESPSASRILGYDPGGLVGTNPLLLVHPEDLPRIRMALSNVVARTTTGIATLYRLRHAQGRYVQVESLGSNQVDNPAIGAIVLTTRDVSDRMKAESSLRRRLTELTVLNASAAISMEARTEEDLITKVTGVIRKHLFPENCGVLLLDPKDGALKHAPSYVAREPSVPRPRIPLGVGITGGVAATGKARREDDVRAVSDYLAVDGEMRSEVCVPIKVGDAVIAVLDAESPHLGAFTDDDLRVLSTLADQMSTSIERLRATSDLQEHEERFRHLSNASFEGIGITEDGRILDSNRRLAQMLGYKPEEMIGRNLLDVLAPESRARAMEHIRRDDEGHFEHVAIHRDGGRFPVEVRARPMPYKGRAVRVTAIRDITERKQSEERIQLQLRRLGALRAIDMAISSSHDLKMTLGIFLEHAKAQLGADAASVLLLNSATQALEFCAGVGLHSGALKYTNLPLGQSLAGRAALERRLVGVTDLQSEPEGFARSKLFLQEGFATYHGAPLLAKGQVKGVLEIFHSQPFDPDQEWLSFLETLAGQAAIAVDNMTMFERLQRSNMDLALAYETTLEGWSKALELRDRETQGHTLRVADLAIRLALAVGVSESDLQHIRRGALLHDIGKMGIPDAILTKPAPLTPEEWIIMRRHPEYARDMLMPITFLRPAVHIPYSHHERWDGSGYPQGLRGEEIPLGARIFAVVDAWDALSYSRPYRAAWPTQRVRDHIHGGRGSHFDSAIVDLFLDMSVTESGTAQ